MAPGDGAIPTAQRPRATAPIADPTERPYHRPPQPVSRSTDACVHAGASEGSKEVASGADAVEAAEVEVVGSTASRLQRTAARESAGNSCTQRGGSRACQEDEEHSLQHG